MINLFVDMDGTLAKYESVSPSALYTPGYFRNLEPIKTVIKGLEKFMAHHPEVKISVLSCILPDRANTAEEKLEWLTEHCPFLEGSKKLFVPCGMSKRSLAEGGDVNFLLDDYSENLLLYENGKDHHGIKLLNGINGKGEKWKGASIDASLSPDEFAGQLYKVISEGGNI